MEAGLHGQRVVAVQAVEEAARDECVKIAGADLNLMHLEPALPAVAPTCGSRCAQLPGARR
jgi:hypothetical protein